MTLCILKLQNWEQLIKSKTSGYNNLICKVLSGSQVKMRTTWVQHLLDSNWVDRHFDSSLSHPRYGACLKRKIWKDHISFILLKTRRRDLLFFLVLALDARIFII